jgi:leader peptidase (prepilin peptidase) / N-methyltransferase
LARSVWRALAGAFAGADVHTAADLVSFATVDAVFGALVAMFGASGPPVPVEVPEPWLGLLLSPWARGGAFVWGLLWGSFANVVIYRIPRGLSVVRPRSKCPCCDQPIASWDNIPIVSYLVLRGRCRHCREPMGIRYLVVELIAGLLGFATYMQLVFLPLLEGGGPNLLGWLLWFTFGLAVLVVIYVDLDVWIIPDAIVLPMALIGLGMAAIAPEVLGVSLVQAVGAALGGYLLFAGIRLLYLKWRGIEALGLGDAKLLLMVGAFTGAPGLLFCIGAGAVQGVLVSVPLLWAGRRVANTDLHDVHGDDPSLGEEDPAHGVIGRRVPFGPFLGVAALEYLLLRSHIDALAQWWISG